MTRPDKDPLNRAQELESIVDQLEEKVAGESVSEDLAGKRDDRDDVGTRGLAGEPPD